MHSLALSTIEDVLGADLERVIACVGAGDREAALEALERIHGKLDSAAEELRSMPTFTQDRDRPLG